MTQTEMINTIEQLFARIIETLKAKSNDYASDEDPFKNLKNSQVVGVTVEQGMGVRMLDKLTRIFNLIGGKKQAVKDESIEDTIIDLIGYLALLYAWMKRKK